MQTLSIKETRDNLSEIVEKVAIAEKSFIVTKFGKPKAMIVPVKRVAKKSRKGLEASFGMWKDRKDMKDSAKWVDNLRNQWKNRYA